MEHRHLDSTRFPAELIEWVGNHSGGVKRLFDELSGRPGRELLRTRLILQLEEWARNIALGLPGTPRVLLLVGGPGNGKTEAVEHTIKYLDNTLGASGALIANIAQTFQPPAGQPVPRKVHACLDQFLAGRTLDLDIVQDATVTAGGEGRSAAQLLLDELASALAPSSTSLYLCCVNRGVLDDALILSLEKCLAQEQALLEDITRAVGLSADAPSCWPLEGHAEVAIWPMDAESLLIAPAPGESSPAEALVRHATNPVDWPAPGTCPAGTACPFCYSQAVLDRPEERAALLQVLRWHELSSGKRWSFRDLFSLMSYLLAGQYHASSGHLATPCEWAAGLRRLDEAGKAAQRPKREQLTALFYLATSGYQHALFHQWDHLAATSLGQDLKDLAIGELDQAVSSTLRGLQYFLQDRRKPYLPATITASLEGLSTSMDPALASPDCEVAVSGRKKAFLWDIDSRFSRSLAGGIEFMRRRQSLSPNELELLDRLDAADRLLSKPEARRKRPGAAGRVQRILRDLACRLVRRSICTRSAVVSDAAPLRAFQLLVEDGHRKHIHEVAQQVKKLLNNKHGFEVSLTTTFGQPLPPPQRQATLVVQPQPVNPIRPATGGRPPAPICFLRVGQGNSAQPIALTYDLFKAVEELERGLSMASLPRTVVAMLDATRSKLAGPIVRDRNALEDATIKLGGDGTYVKQSWDGFVVSERNSNDES